MRGLGLLCAPASWTPATDGCLAALCSTTASVFVTSLDPSFFFASFLRRQQQVSVLPERSPAQDSCACGRDGFLETHVPTAAQHGPTSARHNRTLSTNDASKALT